MTKGVRRGILIRFGFMVHGSELYGGPLGRLYFTKIDYEKHEPKRPKYT